MKVRALGLPVLAGLYLVLSPTAVWAGPWMSLFDGTTLDGWEGDRDVFRVEDGAITAGSLDSSIPRNEFLCTTRDYADFELVLRFRIEGDPAKANAGVQLRSRRIPDHHEMIGYQADIGQHYWGSLYDESRRRTIVAQADLTALLPHLKPDGWNTYRMRCEGRRVRLWINGHATVDYIEPDQSLEQTGLIALQIHSGPPCVVRYKDIHLRDLTDGIPFAVQPVNPDSEFEAAGMMDLDGDQQMDICCGGSWYRGPDWTPQPIRELQPINEYYNDFANLPMDVDGDGHTDIVNAAWFSKSVFWLRNPGVPGKPFEEITIDAPGNIETGILIDIDGDGELDLLPNSVNGPAWYRGTPGTAPYWQRMELPEEASGHGLGAGDIDGDGRMDLVSRSGWIRQGETPDIWIPQGEFTLDLKASIPILVHDVDGDGDADVIWGAGHHYGVFWLEQGRASDGTRTWTAHDIDTSWSQAHFLLLEDMDGDGEPELVTGKRYRAHNGNDPGSDEPLCIMIYRFDRGTSAWNRQVVSQGEGVGFGINTMAGDIDGDGDMDLLAPGKSGLHLLVNQINPPGV